MSADPKYQAALALHRFGLGPRPGPMAGSIAAVAADPRGALLAELDKPGAGLIVDASRMSADKAAMAKYLEEVKPSFAVYLASSIDDDFYKGVDPKWAADGEALPMTTIFDRDGKPAHFYEKALSFEEMEHDVTPLLKAAASH